MLEGRPRAGGKTLVDHAPGGDDDLANALALKLARTVRAQAQPWSGALLPGGASRLGSPSDGSLSLDGAGVAWQAGAVERRKYEGQGKYIAGG